MRTVLIKKCISLLEDVRYNVSSTTMTKFGNLDYVIETLKHEMEINTHRGKVTNIVKEGNKDYGN